MLALCLGVLAAAGGSPASAAQAPGHDVVPWSTGWSWTYATSFRYQADGTDVTINETVSYTVAGTETFQGQDAYRLNLSGTITSGSGSVAVDGVGTASLSNFAGTVSGTRFVRRSDLALLQETQQQNLTARASISLLSANISASIALSLTPEGAWKTYDFPLNPGDSWNNDVDVTYDGGFSYDAGSIGGTGNDTFAGTLPVEGPSTVTAENVAVPIGNVAADKVTTVSADGQTRNTEWWSPNHRNVARQVLELPLDGARLTLTRNLSTASAPAPALTVSQTVTPSLSCAGGGVTVAGTLSSGLPGVPVQVRLDQSQLNPGQGVSAGTTTGAGGAYSVTLPAPAQADGLGRNGARASWGVLVSAGAARNVATLVVTPRNCSTLAYTGDSAAPRGATATVSATLGDLTGAGTAGRLVTFTLAGGATVQGTTDAAGVATASLPVNGPVRETTVTASYAGSGSLDPASAVVPFTVGKIGTTATVAASPDPVTIGEPVTFGATVTPDSAGGTFDGSVQFVVDGADLGGPVALSTGGQATSAPLSTLGLGDHTVRAVYLGNADHATSTSPAVTFRVRNPLLATTTTSTASPATAVFGQDVTLGATVVAAAGGVPTGTVTFSAGGTTLGTAAVEPDGTAALVVDDLAVGSQGVVATYSGDDVHAASAAPPRTVSVTRAAVAVAVTVADDTTVSGEAVNLSASVTPIAPGGGTPTGSLQLLVDGTPTGDPVELDGGAAMFAPLTSLTAGQHTLTAVYAGSASHQGGQDSVTQDVTTAATTTVVTATPSPSQEDQEVAFTATVSAVAPGSGAPTGTVTFTADGEPIGAAPLQAGPGGAQATLALSDLAPGSHQVRASYAGDSGYVASHSEALSHTVIAGAAIVATTTEVTSSVNPSTYGELVRYTAVVTAADGSAPSGTVQFSVDGADVGEPVAVDSEGRARSVTLGSPDPGDHTVIAAFAPGVGYAGSGAILTQTVAAAEVDLGLASSDAQSEHGEPVALTATVASQRPGTGTPSGFVQFRVDGAPLGDAVALVDGTATSPALPDLAPGDHEVTALYSGDVRFAPAQRSLTQSVARIATTTALAGSASATTFGDDLTLTATVTAASAGLGAPTGTVRFVDGTTTIATVPVVPGADGTATATLTTDALGAGAHQLTAVYEGGPAFAPSTSPARSVTVARQPTVVSADGAVVKVVPLGLPLGQLRATLTGGGEPVAGATVVFTIGTATVCTATTNGAGVATCNASAQLLQLVLAGGYRASYAGSADRLPSTGHGPILK
ncbi:Ig-like domain-containing protein [Nocardioides sp. SYSU D00038]|uniref:beta strand repeat-containing protein n=1 Tax=Nocardioides sp. SYSU D00038 TaxID=2812554 RepID=UPI0019672ED0|nr:Ig-like domain-containing protein [Nocardioides sp. SYSU D00038]